MVSARIAYRRPLSFLSGLLVVLQVTQVGADDATSRESLANERFPVNAQRIEEQWGVDCGAAIDQARGLAASSRQLDAESDIALEKLGKTLELCGFIFNTPDSQLYAVCPQYGKWHQWLEQNAELPTACR